MTKPSRGFPRPLADLLHKTISEGFARQGFASTELVTRWADIVGADIAAHCEPAKIQWPRQVGNQVGDPAGDLAGDDSPEPGTLVLRAEGPAALEIQHLGAVILERVNRFFGWQAVGRIAIRQAPLRRPSPPRRPAGPDPVVVAAVEAALPEIADDDLKAALARLGAAVKSR